jgi:hypothetical protein
MIYHAQEKNNTRLDRRRIGQFCRFLNEVTLKEIHLQGRLFTWSNERAHPTLERIDQVFINAEWDSLFPHHDMLSLWPRYVQITPRFFFALMVTSSPRRGFFFSSSGPASLAFRRW